MTNEYQIINQVFATQDTTPYTVIALCRQPTDLLLGGSCIASSGYITQGTPRIGNGTTQISAWSCTATVAPGVEIQAYVLCLTLP